VTGRAAIRPGAVELDPASAPGEIEARSFALIEEEVGPARPFSGPAWLVARRIVHAAGDLSLLEDLVLPESALAAGLAALAGGAALFTDTEMALAGIVRRRLTPFGCAAQCVLSRPGLAQEAARLGVTRSFAGFAALGPRLGGSVAVVGNAPTALLALLRHVGNGGSPPALVVGMPVGFVNAAEAKELLLQCPALPSLVLRGRRGGSALASAAVNALLVLLAEKAGLADPLRWTGPRPVLPPPAERDMAEKPCPHLTGGMPAMASYYKKILVPVDGSPHAELACRHAVGLADGGDAEILLLHCYGDLPMILGGDSREAVIAASEKEAARLLAPCLRHCEESRVRCRSVIHNGNPSRTIVRVAKEDCCDLIVMGSRGLSDFSGLVMGSVSHRVLEYADIPVLIVK
jgi:precorrin-8X/cobalt-precorrin-8 methylmutase